MDRGLGLDGGLSLDAWRWCRRRFLRLGLDRLRLLSALNLLAAHLIEQIVDLNIEPDIARLDRALFEHLHVLLSEPHRWRPTSSLMSKSPALMRESTSRICFFLRSRWCVARAELSSSGGFMLVERTEVWKWSRQDTNRGRERKAQWCGGNGRKSTGNRRAGRYRLESGEGGEESKLDQTRGANK